MGFKKLTNDSGTYVVQSSNGTETWDICARKVVSRYFPRYHYKTKGERLQWAKINGDIIPLNEGRWPAKWHLWMRANPPITRCRIDHPPHDRIIMTVWEYLPVMWIDGKDNKFFKHKSI